MKFKGITLDYDFMLARNDDDVSIAVCLTYVERQILLALLDYVGWKTRWHSDIGTVIQQDKIDKWRDSIFAKLMLQDCSMDCNDVIACLLADFEGVGDFTIALGDWLSANGGQHPPGLPGDSVERIPGVDSPIIETTPTCDYGNLFGFVRQMVQLANRYIEDFFELVEVASNRVEVLAACVDSVPWLSTFSDFVFLAQDAVAEGYSAYYDVTLENTYACDLFCIAVANDCVLSWDDVLDYFSNRINIEFDLVDAFAVFSDIVSGSWGSTQFCDIGFFVFFYVLSKGADWLGITLSYAQTLLQAFWNDADDDYLALCDDCLWTHEVDLTAGLDGGVVGGVDLPDPLGGVWVSGQGIRSTNLTIGGEEVQSAGVGWVFEQSVLISEVRFVGTLTDIRSTSNQKELHVVKYDSGYENLLLEDGTPPGFDVAYQETFWLFVGREIYVRTVQDRATPNYITSVVFSGVGYNPFA